MLIVIIKDSDISKKLVDIFQPLPRSTSPQSVRYCDVHDWSCFVTSYRRFFQNSYIADMLEGPSMNTQNQAHNL